VPKPQDENRVDLILGLTEKQIVALMDGLASRMVHDGTVLISEGDFGDSMLLVIEGVVQVVARVGTPAQVLVARRSGGQMIGEVNFVAGGPRSASVIAEGDVLFVEFTKAHMNAVMGADPDLARKLAWNLARIMAERLRNTTTQFWDAQSTHDLTVLAFRRLQAATGR